MQDTEALLTEAEQRLVSHVQDFEEEERKLIEHRTNLIKEREKTDRMLARVRRTISALKPEAEQPRQRKERKASSKKVSAERVTEAKGFIRGFLDENEIITSKDLRAHFSEWSDAAVSNLLSGLRDENFLRVAGQSTKGLKRYKLTTEAKGDGLALVA